MIRIKDLKCFEAVASVLGEDRAQQELLFVIYSDCCFEDKPKLRNTFTWDDTPQGADFWCDVDFELGDS